MTAEPTLRELPLSDLALESASRSADLNRIDRSDHWRVVDVRDTESFRKGHIGGSIHLERGSELRHLYLLPPRRRKLCVLGPSESEALASARELRRLGWKDLAFSIVSPAGLPPECQAAGRADSVLWEPDPWLLEVSPELPRTGEGIDLACGSGRDTVYLGWTRAGGAAGRAAHPSRSRPGSVSTGKRSSRVYGVDILPDALTQAKHVWADAADAVAARTRVLPPTGPDAGDLYGDRPLRHASSTRQTTFRSPVETERDAVVRGRRAEIDVCFHEADLSSTEGQKIWLPESRWSVVLVFRYLDRTLLPAIAASLEPGGHLVYRTFLEEQRVRKGRPRSDLHLLRPGELPDAFRELETIRYEEGVDEDGNVLASLWARRR